MRCLEFGEHAILSKLIAALSPCVPLYSLIGKNRVYDITAATGETTELLENVLAFPNHMVLLCLRY